VRELAAVAHCGKSYVHDLETGRRRPNEAIARGLDDALVAGGQMVARLRQAVVDADAPENEAVEPARRVAASDVGAETLNRLEHGADTLAMAYATTPPELLLPRVRRHLDYVMSLIDARKTLAQHRRILVIGGWLALLRATLHIDLRQGTAADAYLVTAGQLVEQADHPEIAAWCLETKAWDVLTSGDFRQALELSQRAQAIAPRGGSALIQATAQEGRAWARLGDRAQTRRILDLALLAPGKPDEAAGAAGRAITSGRIVPSNGRRAREVMSGVQVAGVPEARELREAYETFRPAPSS
jgi:hypothetical protein